MEMHGDFPRAGHVQTAVLYPPLFSKPETLLSIWEDETGAWKTQRSTYPASVAVWDIACSITRVREREISLHLLSLEQGQLCSGTGSF